MSRARLPRLAYAAAGAGAVLLAVPLLPANAGHTNAVLEADLTGRAEVASDAGNRGVSGDPNGTGEAYVFGIDGDPTTLCYVVTVDRIQDGPPTPGTFMAHIHEAPAGENGDVVVNLAFPQGGQSADCLTEGEVLPNGSPAIPGGPGTVQEILAGPSDYYVNVHTEQFPAGAVRGQLAPR
jgi:hypothetical protein